MSCIGPAFVFSNQTLRGPGWGEGGWSGGHFGPERQPQLTPGFGTRCPASLGQPPSGVELRLSVLGKEEGRRNPPSSFLSPLAHGKDSSFLSVSPFTLVLYCSVKETLVTEALSKSARLVQ